VKPSEQRLSEARRQHTEAIVARHVHELFQRLPMLAGFGGRPRGSGALGLHLAGFRRP
jgi:hypothetical protein